MMHTSSTFPRSAFSLSRTTTVVVLATGLAWSSTVSAHPEFPGVIRDTWGMTCTPQCMTCHTSEPGEAGTAGQPFVASLVDAGFNGRDDEDSLKGALDDLAETDTDGDGFSDRAEYENDPPTDLNVADLTPENPGDSACGVETLYGCGAHFSRTPPRSFNAWAFVLSSFLGVLFLTRRARRSRLRA